MEGPWPMEINPVLDWGRIIGGKNSTDIDSITAYLMGVGNVEEIPLLKAVKDDFGAFDSKILESVPKRYIKVLNFW